MSVSVPSLCLYQFHLHAPFRVHSFTQHINLQGWFSFSGTAGEISSFWSDLICCCLSGEVLFISELGRCVQCLVSSTTSAQNFRTSSFLAIPSYCPFSKGKIILFLHLAALTWHQNNVGTGDTQPRDRGSSEFRLLWHDSLSVFYLALKIPVTNFPHSLLVDWRCCFKASSTTALPTQTWERNRQEGFMKPGTASTPTKSTFVVGWVTYLNGKREGGNLKGLMLI